jgi:hypothetical protein
MSRLLGYRVLLNGGDGYCPFFAAPQRMERIAEDWFPDSLGEWGPALLFRVVDGSAAGTYVALTSGANGGGETWLKADGYLPGVAHHIRNAGPSFRLEDADPCGKTVIDLVKE